MSEKQKMKRIYVDPETYAMLEYIAKLKGLTMPEAFEYVMLNQMKATDQAFFERDKKLVSPKVLELLS